MVAHTRRRDHYELDLVVILLKTSTRIEVAISMNKSCSDKNALKALRFYQNDGVTEKLQSDEVL